MIGDEPPQLYGYFMMAIEKFQLKAGGDVRSRERSNADAENLIENLPSYFQNLDKIDE